MADHSEDYGGQTALSLRTTNILRLIARGYGYDAIMQRLPECTCLDIAAAAQEALELSASSGEHRSGRASPVERRARYARNSEPWTSEDEAEIKRLAGDGLTWLQIGRRLRRRPRTVERRWREIADTKPETYGGTRTAPNTITQPVSPAKPPRAGEPWTREEERDLEEEFLAGKTLAQLGARFGRTDGGLTARLSRLGLILGEETYRQAQARLCAIRSARSDSERAP